MESGDAFCVLPCEGNSSHWMLLVFQITVGESHPIKANGLIKILDAIDPTIRGNFTQKLLVFVTPWHSKLERTQPYHTAQGKVIAQSSSKVYEFRQAVCRYKLVKDIES